MHVDQANLVLEAKDVERDRFDFYLGDLFETVPAFTAALREEKATIGEPEEQAMV